MRRESVTLQTVILTLSLKALVKGQGSIVEWLGGDFRVPIVIDCNQQLVNRSGWDGWSYSIGNGYRYYLLSREWWFDVMADIGRRIPAYRLQSNPHKSFHA